ncbi:MAG: phosphatidate cytidylyltransferase [Dehalococcoidia bacterium]|nr:phosphatidate cytidylyltransferase [Dehalococcoidia bacterium]
MRSTAGEAALVAALALLVPPVAMAGDLFESWLKRGMGIKDASGLIPGPRGLHGPARLRALRHAACLRRGCLERTLTGRQRQNR